MTDEADLRALTVALAVDALDGLGARRQAVHGAVRPLAPGYRMVGRARTVVVEATDVIPEEPYVGEMAAIAGLTAGDIPVYQVADGVEAALFGELFALAATARGAVGVVVDGPVRDVRQLREIGCPVFAAGVSPYDTKGRAEVVARDVPIVCGGVAVASGDLVVGDDDGVAIVPAGHVAAVLREVREKVAGERGARADIVAGTPVHEVWSRWRVF